MRKQMKSQWFLTFASVAAVTHSGASLARSKAPGDAVKEAVAAAGLMKTDSVRTRVEKTLNLLNDQHYIFPKNAPPKTGYELDSTRTPDQILEQKVGGGCGSTGLSIAAMLVASGIPSENVRLIGTVVNDELKAICPQEARPVEKKQTPLGLSGHVFIAFKDETGNWFLANSTSTSKPAEIIPWMSPSDLDKKVDRPVQVPQEAFASILKSPRVSKVFQSGMTIFASWKLEDYPMHSFKDRYNLVASGALGNEVCRYDPKSVDAAISLTKEAKKQNPTSIILPPSNLGDSTSSRAL